GINSTRETEDSRGEAVLARIIANPEDQSLAHCLDIVTCQATSVRYAAIEIDGANEFFKRRGLQDDFSFAIGDDACAIKDDSVISTHQVYEDDWQAGAFGPMRNHFTTHAQLALIKRRRID